MAFKPSFQLATDLDLSRAFSSIPMDAKFKAKLSEDWAQLQQGQLNVSEELVIIDERLEVVDERLDVIDGRLDVIDGRLDAIDAEIVVIKQRLDDVEAVAYMAVIT